MARGTFGERLKREREMREVSLREVTSATRIGSRFLEALENEEWDKLPGGVFNRGFVRAIARFLGLDEESLLAEYDLARGEQKIEAPAPPENRIPSAPMWVPAVAVFVILLIGVSLFYAGRYGWRRYTAHRGARHSSAASMQSQRPLWVTPAGSSVVLLELNGQAMPPLGAPGASSTMVFTQKD